MGLGAVALLLLAMINVSSPIPNVVIKCFVKDVDVLAVRLPVKPLDGVAVLVNGSPTPFNVIDDTIYVPIFGSGNIVITYDAFVEEKNGLYRLFINSTFNVTLILDLNRVLPGDLPISGSYEYKDSSLIVRLAPGEYLVSYSPAITPTKPTTPPSPAKPMRPAPRAPTASKGGIPIEYIIAFIVVLTVVIGIAAILTRRRKS